jgi:methyltransferase-like protein/2-polyprenyl-3-methyl-5-hydroxy-6-metoxy-1,4-benzoquinol methylase
LRTIANTIREHRSVVDPLIASYDAVPFDSGPVTGSHPDSLATVATLYGMSPPPVESCRVLELGCSTGGNLVSMALSLPGSSFVGIDLAPRQVAQARAVADAIELTNVDLRTMSIADVDDSFGTFDYIVCHGVYSWVPEPIQDAILRVCSRNLAPSGLAFVSYNTLPGWRTRGMVREMIVYHDDPALPPLDRVARGREFAEFLARSASKPTSVYRAVFERELHAIRQMSDSYFFHEELETENRPVYFAEFARRGAAHGMHCLAEAGLSAAETLLPPDVRDRLREWSGDAVQLEQYLDFVRDRTFRQTVLCHAETGRNAQLTDEAIPTLHLASYAAPAAPAADPSADVAEEFRAPNGTAVNTPHPMLRAALHVLFESLPSALAFPELWHRVTERVPGVGAAGADAVRDLAGAMLQCAQGRLVVLHVHPPRCAATAGERPTASPLARLQATSSVHVTNLRHYGVELPDFDRRLLASLDGTRDRAAIWKSVQDAPDPRDISTDDGAYASPEDVALAVDGGLTRLAGAALLIA